MELVFADSEVAGVLAGGTSLTIRFAAARVVHEGVDGHVPGVGLVFTAARWEGGVAQAFGRLAAGELRLVDGRHLRVPLPFTGGTATAEFLFHNGEQLRVQADGVRMELPPQLRFHESFAC